MYADLIQQVNKCYLLPVTVVSNLEYRVKQYVYYQYSFSTVKILHDLCTLVHLQVLALQLYKTIHLFLITSGDK